MDMGQDQDTTEGNPIDMFKTQYQIRVVSQSSMKRVIAQILSKYKEDNNLTCLLWGQGRAVGKVVSIAEIVKRNISALHQYTYLDSASSQEDRSRSIPRLYIFLSTVPHPSLKDQCGYQQSPIQAIAS
ncbi:hypothetical protein BZG36_00220 [Bifiguratus adelaidae]|uniref:DNA/RNA-binding protein Alba-like domain-containing protein n=1 Tax=Bifiguratus adelaidae TaxID=1938954 RepID=A0A261Y8Z8_9FUNG|nr:hypothetical protein BZG36_00220 [Bifiguratus adelaidae]